MDGKGKSEHTNVRIAAVMDGWRRKVRTHKCAYRRCYGWMEKESQNTQMCVSQLLWMDGEGKSEHTNVRIAAVMDRWRRKVRTHKCAYRRCYGWMEKESQYTQMFVSPLLWMDGEGKSEHKCAYRRCYGWMGKESQNT